VCDNYNMSPHVCSAYCAPQHGLQIRAGFFDSNYIMYINFHHQGNLMYAELKMELGTVMPGCWLYTIDRYARPLLFAAGCQYRKFLFYP
jgi:hypothetical protein